MNAGLDVFQVIADPSRRHMLRLLTQDSLTINELAENFDMSRPAVSKHVKALHEAGFVNIVDVGRSRQCSIKQDGFDALSEWFHYFDDFWRNKMKGLGDLMDREKTEVRKIP